jgi:hypothetical protein
MEELVFLAPMKRGHLIGDQWHATIRIPADNEPVPPPVMDILGQRIVLDIPGKRRFCNHCQDIRHVNPTCRQGQRLRTRLAQQERDLAREAKAIAQQYDLQPPQDDPPQEDSPPQSSQLSPPSTQAPPVRPHATSQMEGVLAHDQHQQDQRRAALQHAYQVIADAAAPTSIVNDQDLAAAYEIVKSFGNASSGLGGAFDQ